MKNIIELLNNNKNVDEWKVSSTQEHSTELFFVKQELQMNRAKDVKKINLTVYKNFEEGDKKFKGSSTIRINPTDTDDEIKAKIDKAALAASFVKNQFYPLAKPTEKIAPKLISEFSKGDVVATIAEMVKEVFAEDNQFNAFINSIEFFITKKEHQIVNSNGINVSYDSYSALIEVITEAKGETEEIELFDMVNFSDFDREFIKNLIRTQLRNSSLRAKAIRTPKIDGIPVIINGKAINEFWYYYFNQTSAGSK